MATPPKFYLTTAIHYTNGAAAYRPRLYEMVASDAIARFKRLDGYDVFATDRHGRARPEDRAHSGPERHFRRRTSSTRSRPVFQQMEQTLGCSARPLHPHHRSATTTVSTDEHLAPDGGQWRHLSRQRIPAGTRCATRPSTTRRRPPSARRRRAARPAGRRSNGSRRRAISSASPTYQDALLEAL